MGVLLVSIEPLGCCLRRVQIFCSRHFFKLATKMTNSPNLIQVGRVCLVISDFKTKRGNPYGEVVVIKDLISYQQVVVCSPTVSARRMATRHLQPLKLLIDSVDNETPLAKVNEVLGSAAVQADVNKIAAVQKMKTKMQVRGMNDFQRYVYRRKLHLQNKAVKAEFAKLAKA